MLMVNLLGVSVRRVQVEDMLIAVLVVVQASAYNVREEARINSFWHVFVITSVRYMSIQHRFICHNT